MDFALILCNPRDNKMSVLCALTSPRGPMLTNFLSVIQFLSVDNCQYVYTQHKAFAGFLLAILRRVYSVWSIAYV